MSATAPRAFPISLLLVALLAGCGSNRGPITCPLNNGCGCGVGSQVCIAPQFLYAAGTSGQVTVFPITSTGALGSSTSVSGPSLTLGMTVLDNQFLYVSNPVAEIGAAVNAWTIGPGAGTLTAVPASPFALGAFSVAGGLANDSALQVVYVADAGKIDALQADSTGALKAISGSPFASGTNLYLTVDPQNRFLFASDDDPPGSVLAFTINSSGGLAAVQGSPFSAATGNTQPGQIVVDASGSFVYATLTTTGQVAAFSISTTPSGALTAVSGSPFAAGSQPLSLATVSNFLYVSNAGDGTVSGYSINSTTGVLTPLSGSPFAIRGAAFAIDPIGPYLYASGSSGILAFTVNTQTGALAPVSGSPFAAPPATVMTVTP
ncbi:MAG: lactonase family protein [Candidatus Sulfotelmatobacter sp.]